MSMDIPYPLQYPAPTGLQPPVTIEIVVLSPMVSLVGTIIT
jgi:hypothetical protein